VLFGDKAFYRDKVICNKIPKWNTHWT
jgi:hypothetical protein